jgi:hypothetical protein
MVCQVCGAGRIPAPHGALTLGIVFRPFSGEPNGVEAGEPGEVKRDPEARRRRAVRCRPPPGPPGVPGPPTRPPGPSGA